MPEARYAERHEIAAFPEHVAIAKVHPRGIAHERVAARDRVAVREKEIECFIHPATLRGPVSDGRRGPGLLGVVHEHRVGGQLHLIDRQAIGLERERLLDRPPP